MWFSTEAHLSIFRLPLTSGIKTSPEVVSDLDFESWLALHAKRGNIKIVILQTVSKNVSFFKRLQI